MEPDRLDRYSDFVAFAEANQLRMVRAAYLICGDRHLAEDLVQGALVKLALHWKGVRGGNPAAYLRTILYRDAVSMWRRRQREVSVPIPPEPRRAIDLDDHVPMRVVFAAALRRLTPKQRAILVLRYFEDYSEAHTAEVLGISIGTVKSQTAVSLRRLREVAPELSALINADSL